MKRSGFAQVSIFVIVFLACAAQAAAPVSPPESRFVWEPGDNLTFTWTSANFDEFYYDSQGRKVKESLIIKLDNIEDRYIPAEGLVYSTTVETTTARYRPFGEYAVIWFMGVKHLAGFPEGKSNITTRRGIDPGRLYKILIDDDASYSLAMGSNLILSEGYVLEITDVNVTGACVILSLKKDEIKIDSGTRKVETGKNYIYETPDGTLIAVHIDSVFEGKEKASVAINGIFQVSQYETLVRKADNPLGVMWVTNISDDTITLKNAAGIVEMKPGQIINILNNIHLKVADSNTLRIHLYKYLYWYSENKYMYWHSEKIEHRGAAGSNNFMASDGLNYAGFLYEADSGNYSESLVITNMTGRRIPKGGLTYTSYIKKMPYAVTEIKGIKPNGTDGSYVTLSLGGNKYTVKSNGLARILIEHGDIMSEKKELAIAPNEFYGKPWELGEGYSLTVTFIDPVSWPRKAGLVLGRNGAILDDVNLSGEYAYSYFKPGENGTPKLITYLEGAFSGSTYDLIKLRYTWFVSDDIIQIKEGDRLGVFNVTVVEPDRMVLINREPIELKAGSSINLLGNRSFFVENSDELRFYPTNAGGSQVMPEGIPVNEVPDVPDVTTLVRKTPAEGKPEKTSGSEAVLVIITLSVVYVLKQKKWW